MKHRSQVLLALLLMLLSAAQTFAQDLIGPDENHIFHDLEKIRKQAEAAPPITAEQITGCGWEIETAYLQAQFIKSEGPQFMDMNLTGTYVFEADHTMELTDGYTKEGTWRFHEGDFCIHKEFHPEAECYFMRLTGDTMEWFYPEMGGLFYQRMKRVPKP